MNGAGWGGDGGGEQVEFSKPDRAEAHGEGGQIQQPRDPTDPILPAGFYRVKTSDALEMPQQDPPQAKGQVFKLKVLLSSKWGV